jgi:hypothetical protein
LSIRIRGFLALFSEKSFETQRNRKKRTSYKSLLQAERFLRLCYNGRKE